MADAHAPAVRFPVEPHDSAALQSAASDDTCVRLRDDPVSLLPGDKQFPAFRLIYQLPRLYTERGFRSVPRVFATWLFGELNAKVIPYALPPRNKSEGFRTDFGYRAYHISWMVVEGSHALANAEAGIVGSLDRLIVAQINRRLLGQADSGPRKMDQFAASSWRALRNGFEDASKTGKSARIATGWLPLPSSALHFYSDSLSNTSRPGPDIVPLSEPAMIFGGANLYPLIRGHLQGNGAGDPWLLVIDEWQPVLVDRFSFDDDPGQGPTQWLYGAINSALRSQPGVLTYANGRATSQPLGLWDPRGYLRVKGTPESPVIELLNQSFVDFANEVGRPLLALRSKRNCLNVAAMECQPFELRSVGPPRPLPGDKPRKYPLHGSG